MSQSTAVHDVAPFRARYRAAISPLYNAWLHAGFVAAWGAATLWFFWHRVANPSALEWLAVPAALLFCNWGEYRIHKGLGHTKTRLGKLFYQRHTGDHHSFFAEGNMHWEGARDWRVILFPPWLIVVFTLTLALPSWWLLQHWSPNAAALFGGTVIAGYLLYEFMHASEHLPDGHPLAAWPWIRQMRRLHQLHHRRSLMAERNLNIVMPLMDWLSGTLHWEPEMKPLVQPHTAERGASDRSPAGTAMHGALSRVHIASAGRLGSGPALGPCVAGAAKAQLRTDVNESGQIVQVHTVEIRGAPEAVLAYAATPAHWPDWHPSSRGVQVGAGAQGPGVLFEEDIHAGGRPGHLRWQVTAYQPGQHWQAEAHGPHRLWLRVDYFVEPSATGTRFERRLVYTLPGLVWGLYNRLIGAKRVEHESVESMARLKQAFEAREAA